jgi:hypothetical protein
LIDTEANEQSLTNFLCQTPNILSLEIKEKLMSNRAIFASILLATTVSIAGLTIWPSSSALATERVNITDRDTKTQELNPEKEPQPIIH